jgi:hypothetical protein
MFSTTRTLVIKRTLLCSHLIIWSITKDTNSLLQMTGKLTMFFRHLPVLTFLQRHFVAPESAERLFLHIQEHTRSFAHQ